MPPGQIIRDAAALGVRDIVLHTNEIEKTRLTGVRTALASLGARIVASPGSSEVWDIRAVAGAGETSTPPIDRGQLIDRSMWSVQASTNNHAAQHAIDGDITTRWSPGRQRPGVWFMIDLGAVREVRGLDLELGASVHDHPRGYVLEASVDATEWKTIGGADPLVPPIASYLRPGARSTRITFPATEARYLRMTTTRRHTKFHWSIHELQAWWGGE